MVSRPDRESPIDYGLFAEVPVDLMVRHQFVPLKRDAKGLHIAMADPTDLERLDELSSTLHTRIVAYVATAGAVEVVLRKGDTTQRVLQEAASGFRISLVRETEHGEEVLDLDRLATDSEMSPIIKLVDTIMGGTGPNGGGTIWANYYGHTHWPTYLAWSR